MLRNKLKTPLILRIYIYIYNEMDDEDLHLLFITVTQNARYLRIFFRSPSESRVHHARMLQA